MSKYYNFFILSFILIDKKKYVLGRKQKIFGALGQENNNTFLFV